MTPSHRAGLETLARCFVIVLVAATLPAALWRLGKVYGAAEALACSDHCAGVRAEHPGQGGRGVLDAQADRCTCEAGEPEEVASFDRGDGRVP